MSTCQLSVFAFFLHHVLMSGQHSRSNVHFWYLLDSVKYHEITEQEIKQQIIKEIMTGHEVLILDFGLNEWIEDAIIIMDLRTKVLLISMIIWTSKTFSYCPREATWGRDRIGGFLPRNKKIIQCFYTSTFWLNVHFYFLDILSYTP